MIQSVETFATNTTNQALTLGFQPEGLDLSLTLGFQPKELDLSLALDCQPEGLDLSDEAQLFGEKLVKIYSNYLENIKNNKILETCFTVDLDDILCSIAPTLTNIDIETSTYKNEIIPHIIMVEIPLIFKFSEKSHFTKKMLSVLSQFSKISSEINQSTTKFKTKGTNKSSKKYIYNHIEQNISKYNKLLNFIQAHICTDEDDFLSSEIIERRKSILGIRYYSKPFTRTKKLSIILTKQVHEDLTICKARLNYDGSEIDYSSSYILRTSSSVDSSGKIDCGLIFGCDTKKEIFDILKVAIENTSLEHLSFSYNNNICSKAAGGFILKTGCNNVTFYLNLHLRHGGCKDTSAKYMDGILPSYSTKILHLLKNKQILVSNVKKIYHNFDIGILANLGIYYIKYHQLVKKKIFQLIELGFNKNDFQYRILECYRPECCYKDIVLKYNQLTKKDVICSKCRIAELCLLCGSNSHFGECTKIDESSQKWIEENTKKCPNCRVDVQKNNGCQHITCVCLTHFCWSCLAIYHPNDITEHYRGGDVYNGRCAV